LSERPDSELRLDGNGAAGLLQEVFPFEMTSIAITCASCRAVGPLGALPAYVNAPGVVVRCARCESVQMRIAHDDGRYWIELRGVSCVEVGAPPAEAQTAAT
jgi:hypothetical protein